MSLEQCCICDEPTGRAGQLDDSIYITDGTGEEVGPLCEDCAGGFTFARIAAFEKVEEVARAIVDETYRYDDQLAPSLGILAKMRDALAILDALDTTAGDSDKGGRKISVYEAYVVTAAAYNRFPGFEKIMEDKIFYSDFESAKDLALQIEADLDCAMAIWELHVGIESEKKIVGPYTSESLDSKTKGRKTIRATKFYYGDTVRDISTGEVGIIVMTASDKDTKRIMKIGIQPVELGTIPGPPDLITWHDKSQCELVCEDLKKAMQDYKYSERRKTMSFIHFNFGDKVKDLITGYEGIVIGRIEYYTGCKKLGVQSLKLTDKDGTPGAVEWLDLIQCELVEAGCVKLPGIDASLSEDTDTAKPADDTKDPGGPMPTPE